MKYFFFTVYCSFYFGDPDRLFSKACGTLILRVLVFSRARITCGSRLGRGCTAPERHWACSAHFPGPYVGSSRLTSVLEQRQYKFRGQASIFHFNLEASNPCKKMLLVATISKYNVARNCGASIICQKWKSKE